MSIRFDKIREWGRSRGLIGDNGKATIAGQLRKLDEEMNELDEAIAYQDQTEIEDAIGDCVVVLTLLADLCNADIEHCIDGAYYEISKRTGRMVDGVFVKDKA